MTRKICSKCKTDKDTNDFHWQNKSKRYRCSWCKICIKERDKEHRQNNLDQEKERNRRYYKNNLEQKKGYNRKYQQTNPSKINAIAAKHRAHKRNQTPVDANISEIQKLYFICAYMNSISVNCKWHIDHIRPLSKGGLHHQDNLQILDSIANMRKGAKFQEETIKCP